MNTALARGLISTVLAASVAFSPLLVYAGGDFANVPVAPESIGGTTAAGYINETNTAVRIHVSVGSDATNVGGTVFAYAKLNSGSYVQVGSIGTPTTTNARFDLPNISVSYLATALGGFSNGDSVTFKEVIQKTIGTFATTTLATMNYILLTNNPAPSIDNVYIGGTTNDAENQVFHTDTPTFDFILSNDGNLNTLLCSVDGAAADDCGSYTYMTASLADGSHTLVATATDHFGQTSATTTDFCVNSCGSSDTTPPVVTVPANVRLEAASSTGAIATFSVSANDAVDGSVTATCDHNSATTFSIGVTTVNCSATDSSSNTGHNSFTITVKDTTAPAITVPSMVTKEATGTSTPVTFSSSATDAVAGSVSVSCDHVSGSAFALGTTTVTCVAHDSVPNYATSTFAVGIYDTTAPSFVASHVDMNATSTSASGAVVTYTAPAATDLADTNPGALCLPASSSTFAVGNTIVGCAATDASGNRSATSTFAVRIAGDTPLATPASGSYSSAQSVTLSQNANSIRYTTDGTTPTCTSGHIYNGPIDISSDTTLKSVACYGDTASIVVEYDYSISIPAPVVSSGGGGGNGPVVGSYGGGGAPIALTSTVPLITPVTTTEAPAGTANGTPIVPEITPTPSRGAVSTAPQNSGSAGHVASAASAPAPQTSNETSDSRVSLPQPTITGNTQNVTPQTPSQVATVEQSFPGQNYFWMIVLLLALLFLGAFLWDTYFSRGD